MATGKKSVEDEAVEGEEGEEGEVEGNINLIALQSMEISF